MAPKWMSSKLCILIFYAESDFRYHIFDAHVIYECMKKGSKENGRSGRGKGGRRDVLGEHGGSMLASP